MVLSGFCLFWPLTGKKPAFCWKDYAVRRARRILPAYYGAMAYAILTPLLLVFAFNLFGWQANPQPIPSPRQIITHLLLIHTLFPDTWDGITGAFWSMGLEAQFYAVFPFLVSTWKRIGVRAIAYAALASLAFRILVSALNSENDSLTPFLLSITFLGRWMQFAAGMAAALWVRLKKEPDNGVSPNHWHHLFAISLLFEVTGLVAPFVHQGPIPLRDLFLAAGSAGLIASLCTAPNWIKAPLLRGPLPMLGRVSYSFFLIHQPTSWYLMEFFRKKLGFNGSLQILLGYTAGLLITAAGSALFYHIFEKPFLSPSPKGADTRPLSSRRPQSVA